MPDRVPTTIADLHHEMLFLFEAQSEKLDGVNKVVEETRDQVRGINGRTTSMEMWKAQMRGVMISVGAIGAIPTVVAAVVLIWRGLGA